LGLATPTLPLPLPSWCHCGCPSPTTSQAHITLLAATPSSLPASYHLPSHFTCALPSHLAVIHDKRHNLLHGILAGRWQTRWTSFHFLQKKHFMCPFLCHVFHCPCALHARRTHHQENAPHRPQGATAGVGRAAPRTRRRRTQQAAGAMDRVAWRDSKCDVPACAYSPPPERPIATCVWGCAALPILPACLVQLAWETLAIIWVSPTPTTFSFPGSAAEHHLLGHIYLL